MRAYVCVTRSAGAFIYSRVVALFFDFRTHSAYIYTSSAARVLFEGIRVSLARAVTVKNSRLLRAGLYTRVCVSLSRLLFRVRVRLTILCSLFAETGLRCLFADDCFGFVFRRCV